MDSGEIPTPTPEGGKDLNQEYAAAAKVGRDVLSVVNSRVQARLTSFNDPARFFDGDVQAINDKGPNVTQQDIARAKRGSFALALEAAAQVAEVQFPRTDQVREDLDSLAALAMVISVGHSLGTKLYKEDRQGVINAAKSAMARRAGTPDKINWGDEEIEAWVNQQFDSANRRLTKGIQAISAYTGR